MEREEQLIVARALAEKIGLNQARAFAQHCKINNLTLNDFIMCCVEYIRKQNQFDIESL